MKLRKTPVTLYEKFPSHEIHIDEFEELSMERIKIMIDYENTIESGTAFKWKLKLDQTHLERIDDEECRKDNISHWILKLAFSCNDNLQKQFLSFETSLLEYRFLEISNDVNLVIDFLQAHNYEYRVASDFEKDALPKYLSSKATYFKLKFFRVHELVGRRDVFVRKGYAYVTKDRLIHYIKTVFVERLKTDMLKAREKLNIFMSDDRISSVFAKLRKHFVENELNMLMKTQSKYVHPSKLPEVAKNSFPMCMDLLYRTFVRDNHLKYDGRTQMQLFFKGIGLTLGDCIKVFQERFFRIGILEEQFNREYAYGIRHAYGQEGKKVNYPPYSCYKIIKSHSSHHGCPFKTYASSNLKQAINSKIPINDVEFAEIQTLVANKEHQRACKRHFEILHKGADASKVGNHPNEWFDASQKFLKTT